MIGEMVYLCKKMNDTVVKTEKCIVLKKKAELLDELIKKVPSKIYSGDNDILGKELLVIYFKNKELWDGE